MVVSIQWMQKWFKAFNSKYFGGELPMPKLKIAPLGREKWGQYDLDIEYSGLFSRKVTNFSNCGILTLNSSFKRNENDFKNTLLHEMVHEYVFIIKKEFLRNPHGGSFAEKAKELNEDGWNIQAANAPNDTEVEIKNGGNYDMSDNDNSYRYIPNGKDYDYNEYLCVMYCPGSNFFDWWVCRVKNQSILRKTIESFKISTTDNVEHMDVYLVKSESVQTISYTNGYKLIGKGFKYYSEILNWLSKNSGIKEDRVSKFCYRIEKESDSQEDNENEEEI